MSLNVAALFLRLCVTNVQQVAVSIDSSPKPKHLANKYPTAFRPDATCVLAEDDGIELSWQKFD